jgi:hypothetical protein
VRELLKEGGRFPCRRTFERRLKALPPETLRGQIGCLGHHLLALEYEQDLRLGLKAFLKAARSMTRSHQDNDRAVAAGIDLPLLRSGNPHIWPVIYIEAGRTT